MVAGKVVRSFMPTIKDVASLAGVSISTVSNVLNNTKLVSSNLTKRVHDAVRQLGYQPDRIASSMKSGISKTIGIITADICGLFYPYVLKNIYQVLEAEEFNLLIFDNHVGEAMTSQKAARHELDIFKNLFASRVDGVIFVSNQDQADSDYFRELVRLANAHKVTPLVSLERDFSDYGIDSVFYDNYMLARIATTHLIDCGCRHIAHISGPFNEPIPRMRIDGYLDALGEHGLSLDDNGLILYGDYTHNGGFDKMKQIVASGFSVDGVYCANDQMAVGALHYLKKQGYSVPEQVKVIGTDDVFIADMVSPSLTTVQIDKDKLGTRAAEILLTRIRQVHATDIAKSSTKQNFSKDVIGEKVGVRLIKRRSTNIN